MDLVYHVFIIGPKVTPASVNTLAVGIHVSGLFLANYHTCDLLLLFLVEFTSVILLRFIFTPKVCAPSVEALDITSNSI